MVQLGRLQRHLAAELREVRAESAFEHGDSALLSAATWCNARCWFSTQPHCHATSRQTPRTHLHVILAAAIRQKTRKVGHQKVGAICRQHPEANVCKLPLQQLPLLLEHCAQAAVEGLLAVQAVRHGSLERGRRAGETWRDCAGEACEKGARSLLKGGWHR